MDIIEQIKQQIAAYGKVPATAAMVMYRDFSHWQSAEPNGKIEDFQKVQVTVAAVAKTLSELDSHVIGVVFNEAEYLTWLGDKPDNRAARALWSNQKAANTGGDWEWQVGFGWVIATATKKSRNM